MFVSGQRYSGATVQYWGVVSLHHTLWRLSATSVSVEVHQGVSMHYNWLWEIERALMPSRVKTREFGFLETFVRRMLGTTDKNRHQKSRLHLSAVNTGNLNYCYEKKKEGKKKKEIINSVCILHWLSVCLSHTTLSLTPSLPQPVEFPGWKMQGRTCKQYVFRSNNFSAVHFRDYPFTCQYNTENKTG